LDPNEVEELQARQLITNAESSDKTLQPVDSANSAVEEVIIYLRASYVALDDAAVIKISQDISYTANNKERYVLYFYVAPEAGKTYIIYRAIVDYD
jgi:hypothetical protein